MHHPITVLRQACKAEAAAAQPLPQPQPQPLSQPQPKSQLQQQADAQARAAAQHAKAKQAQAEYRRLQHHFVQLQQHGRIKGPPWQCPGSVPAPGHMPSALGNSTLSGGRNSVQLHGVQATADLKVADPTLFGPPGSRSSSCYRLSWLRPRCRRRRSNGCSRPARLWCAPPQTRTCKLHGPSPQLPRVFHIPLPPSPPPLRVPPSP